MFRFLCLLTLLPIAGGEPAGEEGMIPNNPVVEFHLPRFSPTGVKEWEIRGTEAVFTSRERIAIRDLRIAIGDPDPVRITSPEARVDLGTESAEGPGPITVEGAGFSIRGGIWSWRAADRRVRISGGAEVRFDTSLQAFLR